MLDKAFFNRYIISAQINTGKKKLACQMIFCLISSHVQKERQCLGSVFQHMAGVFTEKLKDYIPCIPGQSDAINLLERHDEHPPHCLQNNGGNAPVSLRAVRAQGASPLR